MVGKSGIVSKRLECDLQPPSDITSNTAGDRNSGRMAPVTKCATSCGSAFFCFSMAMPCCNTVVARNKQARSKRGVRSDRSLVWHASEYRRNVSCERIDIHTRALFSFCLLALIPRMVSVRSAISSFTLTSRRLYPRIWSIRVSQSCPVGPSCMSRACPDSMRVRNVTFSSSRPLTHLSCSLKALVF